MAKKQFRLLTSISSNEVSLCSKYNSGANKQTEFELVKNQQGTKDSNMKEVLQKFIEMCEEKEECCAFHDFLNYWMQYDLDNTYYNLLSEALRNGIYDIKEKDIPKEEKEQMFINLFNMFLDEFRTLPISKTKEGRYEVSLSTKSHNQEVVENPQSETDVITKEKTSKMEKQNMFEQAIDLLKTALGLEKSETPAEEQQEVQPQVEEVAEETQEVETPATEEVVEEGKTEEVEPAEVEAPVVEEVEKTEEKAEETVVEEEGEREDELQEQEEKVTEEEKVEEVAEEEIVEKTQDEQPSIEELVKAKLEVEKELAELKKANEIKAIEIEKMSFVQKAKDEYSMLVGTPEEIGEKLYSISKSSLDEEVKSFVMEQLKKVAKVNEELTEEVGSITKNAGDMTDEEVIYAKAEELAKAENISINKALRKIK